MKLTFLMIFPIFWNFECLAMPLEQGSVTVTVDVTPYPGAQRQYIDTNDNVSPVVTKILQESGMNLDELKALKEKLQNQTLKGNGQAFQSSTVSILPGTREFSDDTRLANIRNSLEKTLRGSGEDIHSKTILSSSSEFEYSQSAVCAIPLHFSLSDWFDQKTWNIFFKPPYRFFNIKSVLLRLFKVAPSGNNISKECDPNAGNFYKLVVSMYYRKRKEMKKRTIYVETIGSDFTGWVEINAMLTMKGWENAKNNYGLAIDVYDQDENQLDAKEHFHLQNCEAGPEIPWRAFKLLAESFRTNASQDVVDIYRNLYTGPRLDITSSTPAKYSINSNENQQEEKKISRHLRHTHHRRHPQRTGSEESMEHFDSKSNQLRRDHSHRSNSKVENT